MAYVRHIQSDDDEETADRPEPEEPEELVDSRLLSLFPGRTLEELDQMDLNRYHRALMARHMETVEARRKLFMAGKLKAEDIEADEWALIERMDELANAPT